MTMTDCINTSLEMFCYQDEDEKEKIHFDHKKDFLFWGKHEEMVNILYNLMKNAYHFIAKTNKGDITIWLENKKNKNELHFKDTGPGMSQETVNHLFEPFFTEREGGTGLGLNFCRKAMEAFKGEIKCHSKLGEFTEFILIFPD